MANFFADNFSNCVALAVFLMAMFPMVESKVAIPFALSTVIWGEGILSPAAAYFVALLGSMVPAILVVLLARFVRNHTSGFVHDKFSNFIERRYQKNLDKVSSSGSVLKKCLLLGAFVAVPLPLTGTYSGGLIAGFTKLKFWQIFVSILIGEMISCALVLLICMLFENSAFYLFIASLILIAVFVVLNLLWAVISKCLHKKRKEI